MKYLVRQKERGEGPFAIFCRDGRRSEAVPLEGGEEVRDATKDEGAQVPADIPGHLRINDDYLVSREEGVYVMSGRRVVVLYGCDLEAVQQGPVGGLGGTSVNIPGSTPGP